ncbi:MAG TPA: lysophospholipid acyltransferase family protein [Candidatus Baltobacteraceae bacterium]|nr:lysophospholipid acyltransferase family protein [Candidatus Baltobacteraceae bacterium]
MNTFLYDLARNSFRGMFAAIWRMRIYGAENVPKSGPLIVACNHVSYFDPPVLGAASPRRISYMAKEELFAVPVLGPLIHAVGAYPVDRKGSATSAIKRSVDVLRQGGCIGIFPEGGRNPSGSAEVRGGVALLASLGKAPVVPARLVGTSGGKRLEQFRVYFGRPLTLPQDRKASREEMANFTDQVMRAIRSLPAQQ